MVLGQAEVPWRLQTVLEKIKCLFGTLQTKRNIDFSVSGVLPLAGRLLLQKDQSLLPTAIMKKVVSRGSLPL
ncbi:unnamed protein product [Ilex paraguariensis]|uniref:Uncharacterized protein n=1 Tax=Ilex paraguariensis TaxID=185542 RepID=A0ABC8UWC2_9AQUA